MPGSGKEQILAAAMELFSSKGYVQTSMADVAKAVGLTKGGIYHHIDKKDDLLQMIHNDMADAFLNRVGKSISIATDPREKLSNWIAAHIYLMRDYHAHIKIFFTELENLAQTEALDQIIDKRDTIFNLLHDILKEGIEAGHFRSDLHSQILTLLIFGMLNWFYQWYRPDGSLPIETIIDEVTRFISTGINAT